MVSDLVWVSGGRRKADSSRTARKLNSGCESAAAIPVDKRIGRRKFRLLSLRTIILVCSLGVMPLFSSAFAAREAFVEGEALVIFKPGFGTDAARAALAKQSIELDRQYRNISARSGRVAGLVRSKGLGTAKLIERLKADPAVENAEPNFLRHVSASTPNDTDFPKLWGLQNTGQAVNGTVGTAGVDTRFIPAWKLSRPSTSDVVVGVVDTGVDVTHPDLAANVWTNPGETAGNGIDDDGNGYVDDVHGYDFVLGSPIITDSGSHGTHVAGTLAAVGKNAAGVIGVQHRAKILPLKASDDGEFITVSAAIDAYEYSIDLKQGGVNIVALNASFSSPSSSTSERLAVEALRDNGIVLCAAAGNDGADNNTASNYPANYTTTNILSVAALTQTNGLASFSNYGSTSVDLAAPGANIYSTIPQGLVATQSQVSAAGSNYASQELEYSGTTTLAGITGTIHHCGIGNPGDFPPAVSGNIALIERGTLTFATKVTNAMNAGAVAAIIYDNTSDPLSAGGWTLGGGSWIPAVQVTQASGQAILAALPAGGTVVNYRDPTLIYQFKNGTSMAAPHVAGAVAFAALNFPAETLSQRIARITNNVTLVPALAGRMTTGGRLDLLKMIDTDGDGLADWWENDYFGNLAHEASGDDDADGFSNRDEFLAATDPTDAASHLSFTSFAPLKDGLQHHFVLSFPSVEDRGYFIEWSETLGAGSWQPLGSPVIGTGAILQIQDTDALHSSVRRFYRMSLLPE